MLNADISLRPYKDSDAKIVDTWLDSDAVRFTGIDNGWQEFYDYWIKCAENNSIKDIYCYTAYNSNFPIGVIFIGTEKNILTISELIIAPELRRKGYGSKVLNTLILSIASIIGRNFDTAKAVIFPSNLASQRCFEKAGFKKVGMHPDGDAVYYERDMK